MESRLNKYNNTKGLSRVSRNEDLYKRINDESLDGFTVESNATVIGNQEPEIDIEKIKKILDMRYKEQPRRKSIRIEENSYEKEPVTFDDTKEYDLNAVLEKAKDEKVDSYNEQRAKKLHNTQLNILNSLHVDRKEAVEENPTKSSEENLMELINTITINEAKKKQITESAELDLFDDLKGNENTEVYAGMTEDIKTKEENTKKAEPKSEDKTQVNMDNSFYSGKLFNKKDFLDNEFIENKKLSIWVKVLISLIIIAFLIGVFLFLKSYIGF